MANIVNEVCNSGEEQVKYYGGKSQCTEKPVKTIIMADENQSFTSRELMDMVTNWKAEVKNKKLYPFPLVEGIEDASTEAKTKEGRYKTHPLKNGVDGVKYRFDVSICTYSALKTLQNSKFKRVFEITEANEVTCDKQADGSFKGRKLSTFFLEQRKRATDDDVPFVNAVLKFANDEFSIVKPKEDVADVEGIYGVNLSIISATATEIKFKAVAGCSGEMVGSLEVADVVFLDTNGLAQTISALSYANGIYTVTGSGFVPGTLATNGVVEKGDVLYEADETEVTI